MKSNKQIIKVVLVSVALLILSAPYLNAGQNSGKKFALHLVNNHPTGDTDTWFAFMTCSQGWNTLFEAKGHSSAHYNPFDLPAEGPFEITIYIGHYEDNNFGQTNMEKLITITDDAVIPQQIHGVTVTHEPDNPLNLTITTGA